MARGAEPALTFGVIRAAAGTVTPITWQLRQGVTATDAGIRFTTAGVSIQTDPLPLRSLRLYDIAMTMRRGPGTRTRFMVVFEDAHGVRHERQPVWQCPDESRPDWFPLSPHRQRYVQGLILPPDTKRVWLELAVDNPEQPDLARYLDWEVFALEFVEGAVVPFKSLGGNQLSEGSMEVMDSVKKAPLGWDAWVQKGPPIQVMETHDGEAAAPDGRHFLRVPAGAYVMLGAKGVPVQRGRAWLLSLWVRGKGAIQMLAHSLNGERVGDAQSQIVTVESAEWRKLELLWFAESPRVKTGQIVLGINAMGNLDVDDVAFQVYESKGRD